MRSRIARGLAGAAAVLLALVVAGVAAGVPARAEGQSPISVTGIPQTQTEDGTRSAELSVSFEGAAEDVTAALVEVSFDANEAAALDWKGTKVSAESLDGEKDEGGAGGTEGTQGTPDAVLATKSDGSAVLRLLVEKSQDSQNRTLTFNAMDGDVKIDVDHEDVLAKTYTTSGEQPDLTQDALLDANDEGVTKPTTEGFGLIAFTVYEELPAELVVTAPGAPVAIDGESPDIVFKIDIQKFSGGAERSYTVELALPEALMLPEGELALSDGGKTITCGKTKIVSLGLVEGVTASDVVRTEHGLSLTVSVAASSPAPVDAEYHQLSLTVSGADLVRIPESIADAEMTLSVTPPGEGAEPVTATATVSAAEAETPGEGGWHVEPVEGENTTLRQAVFWADNNNEEGVRPTLGWGEDQLAPRLFFTIDGVRYELNSDTREQFGMTMPENTSKDGQVSLELPSKIHEVDGSDNENPGSVKDVTWSIEPPTEGAIPDTYSFVNVTDANKESYPSVGGRTGWYFMLREDFTLTLDVRQGLADQLSEENVKGLLGNFQFEWTYGTAPESEMLGNLLQNGNAELSYKDGKVTVTGLWKYNVDGTPITYRIMEAPEGEDAPADGRLDGSEEAATLEEGDWYQIHYVNTGVPNYGDHTDAVYNGGTLRLVRQGETTYSATKVWRDLYAQNPGAENAPERPEASFTLYRYRNGQPYTTATPVLDVTASLEWKEPGGEEKIGHWEVVIKDDEGQVVGLPEYDTQDGYRYIYVVRETLDGTYAGEYEQFFGKVSVDADGNVTETPDDLKEWNIDQREEGNDFLYNGDTLTNRRTNTVLVSATKNWNAASTQNTLDDVVVELELQCSEKYADNSRDWKSVTDDRGEPVKGYIFDFYAEKRSDSLVDPPSMPQYRTNADGTTVELEYRWVETAVYTGIEANTKAEVAEAIAKASDEQRNTVENDKVTVKGSDYLVTEYYAGSNRSTITNTLDDSLTYEVEKKWQDENEAKEIAIQIFRAVTGSDFDYQNPYVTFSFEENGSLEEGSVKVSGNNEGGVTVEQAAEGDWHVLVENLPKYDDQGRAYEYLLIEPDAFPMYTTSIDESGNYETIVFNGGGGQALSFLVRKNWLDESDVQHRDPVTFTVYNKHTNEPVQVKDAADDQTSHGWTITLGGDDAPTVWYKAERKSMDLLVQNDLGENEQVKDEDDIYIVETSIGTDAEGNAHEVDHHLDDALTYDALYQTGKGDDGQIFDVRTDNHRYQVTYENKTDELDEGGLGGIKASFMVTNRRLGNINLTVTKEWVDGSGQVASEDALTPAQQIAQVLEEIYDDGEGATLALAFRLKFDVPDDQVPKGWEITNTGPFQLDDTVTVGDGGENTPIYSDKDWTTPASSDQIIIGLKPEGEGESTKLVPDIRDSAYFYGLPKYDSTGGIVSYTVEEVWLKVTKNADRSQTATEISREELKQQYSELYNLWRDYTQTTQLTYEPNVDDAEHTLDEQTLEVTNTRTGTKDVVWNKHWADSYAQAANLRPDIYLDIYRVVHVEDTDGEDNEVYRRKIEKYTGSVTWGMTGNDWTATLENAPKYDRYGFEYFYYAVERTVMSADDYDYQAAQYSLGTGTTLENLGTRDEPNNDATILGATPAGDVGDRGAYDLLVLGTRDESDDVSSIGWANEDDQPQSIGAFEDGGYAKYALVEGGTFTNELEEDYAIEGVKYWNSLPNGWPDARLPKVTFEVYRTLAGEKLDEDAKPVATLTIDSSQWAQLKSGDRYRYLIEYTGTNTLAVENGELVCSGGEDATLLPRYDDNGALYQYSVEEVIDWTDTDFDGKSGKVIFDTASNDFTFTNTYSPTTGSIAVKKFLYLPIGEDGTPEAYPAVTFELTRERKKAGESEYESDPAFTKQTKVLTSAQVEELWNKGKTDGVVGGKGADEKYVYATLVFDDLPLYAPDGSEYKYTLKERTDYLQGYEATYAYGNVDSPDNVSTTYDSDTGVTELEPTVVKEGDTAIPTLTFRDKQFVDPDAHTVEWTATKTWEDFGFDFRPSEKDFAELLIVERYAPKQGGTDGEDAIAPEVITDWFEIEVKEGDDGDSDSWTISVKPKKDMELEKYAPNGAEWRYRLREPLTDGKGGATLGRLELNHDEPAADENNVYTPDQSDGIWPTEIGSKDEKGSFGNLKNSTHTKVSYKKVWKDAGGNVITEDFLGVDLTVTFQLQVREKRGKNFTSWENAGGNEIVKDAMGEDWPDTVELTGRVNAGDDAWSGFFDDLPGVAEEADATTSAMSYVFLVYRVVETSVEYGDVTQAITYDTENNEWLGDNFNYIVSPSTGLVSSASFVRTNNLSTSTNMLATTSVSVTKVWDDGDNQYSTRPGADGPWTWRAWFVLQRTFGQVTEDSSWENVAVFDDLHGKNGESVSPDGGSWSATISGLPTVDENNQPYTYRVRELEYKADGYKSLDDVQTEDIVTDVYDKDGYSYSTTYASEDNSWTVTNSLGDQTVEAVKVWKTGEEDAPVASVDFELEYRTDGETTYHDVPFVSQATRTASAQNDWKVSWTGLPTTIEGERVTYRVVEKSGMGWVQLSSSSTAGDGNTTTWTFTNTISTSFSAEKKWNPGVSGGSHPEVTLALYRVTDEGEVWSTEGEAVGSGVKLDGTVDGVETEAWKATFSNLPKYDSNNNLYHYYVLELDSEGKPVPQGGVLELGNSHYIVGYEHLDDDGTVVTNTLATSSVAGSKTWLDDGNSEGDRPSSLTLKLERRPVVSGDEEWETVNAKPTWWDTNGNQWSYRYDDLPLYDPDGNKYEYRVTETEPEGYELKDRNNFNFINVRAGTVTINGTKSWAEGTGAQRPGSIDLKLERSTDGKTWKEVTGVQLTWDKTNNPWSFSFSGLEQFDEQGVRYQYRVTENSVPAGYEVLDSTNTDPTKSYDIVNYQLGGITIEKEVAGNLGERDREFTFTIKLSGTSHAGTEANAVNGEYDAAFTDADGVTTKDKVIFTNGASEKLKLSHGEFVSITGLPAGLDYEVTETEANKDGYTTTSTGAVGTVPVGGAATARFRNYRHSSPTPTTSVSGTKTWVDDSNAEGTRPGSLTLRLYRSVEGGEEELVHVTPTWTKSGDVWSYSYTGLLKNNEAGLPYIYRVEEVVPEGYEVSYSGNSMTNTLVDEEDPDEPDDPDEPTDPDEPDEPEDPDEPTDPDEPDEPQDPDEPNDPGDPDEPEEPGTPEEPGKPSEPQKPGTPEVPDSGDPTPVTLPAVLLALGVVLLAARHLLSRLTKVTG